MMSERRYVTAEDAADLERWALERRRRLVRELLPYLLCWAEASEGDKPKALAAFCAAVELKCAAHTAEAQVLIDTLAITAPAGRC